MSAFAIGIALAGAAALAGLLLIRFGLRGPLGSRVLARGLHASAGRRRIARSASAAHARVLAATRGRVLGRWFGPPVLVIETMGRRSGLPRRTPIVYARDGDRFVVTPANAGAEGVPAWWLNLRAAGRGAALVDGRRVVMRAVEADGAERERLWRLLVEMSPAIARYQDFTERRLPVVVLNPEPVTEPPRQAGATRTPHDLSL